MRLVPIASDGWRFIVPFLVVGITLLFVGHWWATVFGWVSILLGVFCLNFFRDFDRSTVIDDSLVYSPGDGKVVAVEPVSSGSFTSGHLIRIFLSVFDVHIQRVPSTGKVESVVYQEGKFLDARHPEAHLQNEQSAMILSTPKGKMKVTQIAGLIARRILCWAKSGDTVKQGERYGLIRFGSQVDVLLPSNVEILVKPGQRAKGGLTVLARWK